MSSDVDTMYMSDKELDELIKKQVLSICDYIEAPKNNLREGRRSKKSRRGKRPH